MTARTLEITSDLGIVDLGLPRGHVVRAELDSHTPSSVEFSDSFPEDVYEGRGIWVSFVDSKGVTTIMTGGVPGRFVRVVGDGVLRLTIFD